MSDAQNVEAPRPGITRPHAEATAGAVPLRDRFTVREGVGMALVLVGGLAWLAGAGAGLITVAELLSDLPSPGGPAATVALESRLEWLRAVLMWGLVGGTAVGWLGFGLIASTIGRSKSSRPVQMTRPGR